ncbi:hypothetical protein BJV78DRAFT_407949 [Lactifluus subvellereus]|nr:hypothetical protein BJV78DRAFT_407949 [Lactifluus subvellereus]
MIVDYLGTSASLALLVLAADPDSGSVPGTASIKGKTRRHVNTDLLLRLSKAVITTEDANLSAGTAMILLQRSADGSVGVLRDDSKSPISISNAAASFLQNF